jgi:hypothetical protein
MHLQVQEKCGLAGPNLKGRGDGCHLASEGSCRPGAVVVAVAAAGVGVWFAIKRCILSNLQNGCRVAASHAVLQQLQAAPP